MTSDKVLIGKIVNAHGIKGDVKVKSFTMNPADVCSYTPLLKSDDSDAEWIWFHVSSLGEFEQGLPLIEKIKERYPKYKLLLTFFSPSGYEPKYLISTVKRPIPTPKMTIPVLLIGEVT